MCGERRHLVTVRGHQYAVNGQRTDVVAVQALRGLRVEEAGVCVALADSLKLPSLLLVRRAFAHSECEPILAITPQQVFTSSPRL